MSEFCKRVALGHTVQSKQDMQAVRELLRINADLGRLGGLLKLWLTNDDDGFEGDIRAVLKKIEATQDELRSRLLAI